MATYISEYEVQPGDRIDTIANKLLGNPYNYKEVVEENPFLDIWNPQPGMIIKVPEARSQR